MFEQDLGLQKYFKDLQQEIRSLVEAEEEGASTEEKFTEYMIDFLAEAGETENAVVCTDIREDSIGRKRHKINGYALSESFETLDLFITITHNSDTIQNLPKSQLETAVNLAKRFLITAITGYHMDIEESAPIFDLACLLYKKDKALVRVNIFILSDYVVQHDPLAQETVRDDILVNYHLWDLDRFYRLWTSTNKREPVEIDFGSFGGPIPCLVTPDSNEAYRCYMAIIPGETLSNIYKVFGSRLLEQNVRTFLQFTGNVNKGIRDTIRDEPYMFLPYNNGIACTAEEVELLKTPTGFVINRAKDFQIVNGGQTTASIFHTHRKFKADLSPIFVQMKLTVIKNRDDFSSIVSRISRYANSQNKVTNADLTSNNPFHVRLEELSRTIWAPDPTGLGKETRWFFERARGQYRDAQNRELTRKRRKAFEARNPSRQRFQKEDIAKYVHAWECKPFLVVRGRQKNYAEFMKTVEKIKLDTIDNVYFEDLVAKAILFKTAEKRYGVGKNAIGDIRFIVVPYSLSWLSGLTESRIDLYKIWKNQGLSDELTEVLDRLLHRTNSYLKTEVEGDLISEWAKKEDCWNALQSADHGLDLAALEPDLRKVSDDRYNREKKDLEELKRKDQVERIKSVPYSVWKKIEKWGSTTGKLDPYKRNIAAKIADCICSGKALSDIQIKYGLEILDTVRDENPDLLETADDAQTKPEAKSFPVELTPELLFRFLKWERKECRLAPSKYDYVKQRLNGNLSAYERAKVEAILLEAGRNGFELTEPDQAS